MVGEPHQIALRRRRQRQEVPRPVVEQELVVPELLQAREVADAETRQPAGDRRGARTRAAAVLRGDRVEEERRADPAQDERDGMREPHRHRARAGQNRPAPQAPEPQQKSGRGAEHRHRQRGVRRILLALAGVADEERRDRVERHRLSPRPAREQSPREPGETRGRPAPTRGTARAATTTPPCRRP